MARIRKPYESLAGKLIIATGIILFCGSLLFGFLFFDFNKNIMLTNLENHGRSSADLVWRALRYSMLSADYGVMQRAVEAIAASEDIQDIKVFDPSGKVVFASNPADRGGVVEKTRLVEASLRGETTSPLIYRDGPGRMEFLIPVLNEPSCSTAKCHAPPEEQRVLGVLKTTFSTAAIDNTKRQMFRGTIFFGIIYVVSASVLLILIFYKFVSRPVKLLEQGMRRLATGNFDTPIDIRSSDEMGLLARTFNTMAADIKEYRENMENWTKNLQDEVDRKTTEIVNAQEQIINAEKLASLGRMSAGVAHELNSPLTGIITFAHFLKSRTPPDKSQDLEDINVIIEQAERCTKIIKGMLGFARKGVSEVTDIDVNELLKLTVEMVKNQAKFHNVNLVMELGADLAPVKIDPNSMQQVFLNMLTNAADAMNDKGEIRLATREVSEGPGPGNRFVEIEVTDNGPGIYPNNLGKIFEPFFTTKPVGKGTGLGLPVSYGIVKKHGGDIVVRSKVGEGTSFFIRLPASLEENEEAHTGKEEKQ